MKKVTIIQEGSDINNLNVEKTEIIVFIDCGVENLEFYEDVYKIVKNVFGSNDIDLSYLIDCANDEVKEANKRYHLHGLMEMMNQVYCNQFVWVKMF